MAKLTDKLFQPKFNFSLEFPLASVINSEPTLAFGLQQLLKNENEMNKQATYLVVLGVFAPVEGGSGQGAIGEGLTNSISGIFFNVINEQVKKIVSNIFKTDKLNFNFSSSIYNRNVLGGGGGGLNLGSNVNASIGSSLFKNRVIVTLGGSVEGVLTGNTQQNVGFLKDFTIEILLNESGTFRANLFLRDNVDYLTSVTGANRQNRTGVGLSYRKDFNHIGDIFRKKKPKPLPKIVELNPEIKKVE